MTKVSVLMPAYNAGFFIEEAIESVLSQDYQNLQLVICDDASTDNTVEIISRYKMLFPEKIIAIFNEVNVGVTCTCNRGLKYCDGEFVALFAGDDVMLPGKISKQIALMMQDPSIVLSYHPVEIFDSASGKTLVVTNQHVKDDINSYQDILLKGCIPGGCSIMIQRSAIPEGAYDPRLKTVSDLLFFVEVALCGSVVKVDEILARYRKHANGLSQKSYNLLDESLHAFDLLVEKYPHLEDLPELTLKAKARYVAGEAFRQLKSDKERALALSKTVLFYCSSDFRYYALFFLSFLNARFPGINFLTQYVTNKGKLS